MAQKLNKKQGNDQIIADFFKKSIWFVLIITMIIAIVYFYQSRENTLEIVEKEYQPPEKLKIEISPPEILFSEEAEKRGINFVQQNGATGERLLPETMGSGVAFIDFDNDNDEDLIFVNSTSWVWDSPQSTSTQEVYENDGSGKFTNVTVEKGLNDMFYGTGIAVGDVNNDGYDDVVITAVGNNRLYMNQSGENFIHDETNLDCTENGWSTSAGFFDYDNDGDLDLMILNYVKWSKELDLAADYRIDGIGRAYGPPANFPGTHSCLYENVDGQLFDVTEKSGMIVRNPATNSLEGKSLALTFTDINSDGFEDVIVANDTTRNFVFVNQGNKTFKEQGAEFGLAYDASGKATGAMGLDVANYKNDADVAVTVGNFANEMTSFYVNRASLGFFTDESVITGIGPQSRLALTFGLFFFDYDLDGMQDFFQTNGHVENEINKVQSAQHYAQKSQLFWNCGDDCERTYIAVENAGDLNSLDLVGRAAAYGDIDNDGDLDIVVTQVAGLAKLFINQATEKNWIGIKLLSQSLSPIGATIEVHTSSNIQKFKYSQTKSYLSQAQKGIIAGLGDDKLEKIVISYRDGVKSITDFKINNWNLISLE